MNRKTYIYKYIYIYIYINAKGRTRSELRRAKDGISEWEWSIEEALPRAQASGGTTLRQAHSNCQHLTTVIIWHAPRPPASETLDI